jgi:6-phosphogluconolactonase/glucosamine-6-phosphate isomerase/deaminase
LALSGGSTAPAMIAALLTSDVPWSQLGVWQVDERVAPDGHLDRNANQLTTLPCRVELMPVTAGDLAVGSRRYTSSLPARFDVVHLGLGADGHTASWPPGHEILKSRAAVDVVMSFNGLDRMTLTKGVVNGARSRVVLASGASKRSIVERWLLRDPSLPIDLVRRSRTFVFLDHDAAPAREFARAIPN